MPDAQLVTLTDPRTPAAEAYRALRTNLMFFSLDKPLSRLLVTSPVPGEGKSTVLANLAVTLAQGGNRTIVVDADLRKPSQHDIWHLDNQRGLTTMLIEDAEMANPAIQATSVPNLSVLTSGPLPPNPADVLGSRRMDEVIAALAERADYVLFDAPPALAVTDAALLSAKVDGVILVLRAGMSQRDHAARAKEQLERVKAPLIGTVLTNARYDAPVGSYYSR
ncbi:MAG TPA: CpsD/CapB family tyrosine-protein kinase [Aggregatilinea sp.]|jgi:non-specific protein-tyrosine kinase|uniref:CpsD/CapB family tyrosine-protein kinase n=1 Tax=Aggregatilinea sp. TaxID=2806333 RepID=UPI002CB875E3|nr:CpsD/CapB family tyrosine-protein kinase [Aggregatilinea sp.]HML20433.1 CpsD/CapB family tyrosine-protein kinase [Aggregatilinea sp.]